jgi:hypothetical protein
MSRRRRFFVSRGLLLTEPREVITDCEGPAALRVGVTVSWCIPQFYEVKRGDAFSLVNITRVFKPATIQQIDGDRVRLRVEIERAWYVRYPNLEAA